MTRYEVTFSEHWRKTFGRVDTTVTEREVAFLTRVLPLPAFRRVLDVPCAFGRHMSGLAQAGYDVVGVDNEPCVINEARDVGLDARVGDMRDLGELRGFDAVICMWASFGFFDAMDNARTVAAFADAVRPGGRVVLDLYDPAFFESRQGTRDNNGVLDTKHIRDGRLFGRLEYGDGSTDTYSWQLFTPDELAALAAPAGLDLVLACAAFDPSAAPAGNEARMQVVLERATG